MLLPVIWVVQNLLLILRSITGKSGLPEVVLVIFEKIKYRTTGFLKFSGVILTLPIKGGQFADRGYQYVTAIFCTSEQQKDAALKSRKLWMIPESLKNLW